jgi:hypothetical protein
MRRVKQKKGTRLILWFFPLTAGKNELRPLFVAREMLIHQLHPKKESDPTRPDLT